MKKLLVVLLSLSLLSCEARRSKRLTLSTLKHDGFDTYYMLHDIPIDSFYIDSNQNVHFFGKTHTGIAPLSECFITEQ